MSKVHKNDPARATNGQSWNSLNNKNNVLNYNSKGRNSLESTQIWINTRMNTQMRGKGRILQVATIPFPRGGGA